MVGIEDITRAADAALEALNGENNELFLVEAKAVKADEFEVVVDSDSRVGIEQCIGLSKAIEAMFDRDKEGDDFSLTVMSAGIGVPLKNLRQYRKLVGRQVEVTLEDGKKISSVLQQADPDAITILGERIPYTEIKKTIEHIDFK